MMCHDPGIADVLVMQGELSTDAALLQKPDPGLVPALWVIFAPYVSSPEL